MNAPKPTALKLLQGNPGRRPVNESEPKPKAVIPKCPKHLDKTARQKWRELSQWFFDLGLLTQVDGDALAIYCQAYSDWVTIEEHLKPTINEAGETEYKDIQLKMNMDVDGKVYYEGRSNPRVKHKYELWKIMKSFIAEFGMTPSSRAKFGVQPKEGKKKGIAQYLT